MSADPRTHRFANNAAGRLAADLTDNGTTVLLQNGQGAKFPTLGASEIFKVSLYDVTTGDVEICHCTHVSGDTLTVERGQEGTTARVFFAGALVVHAITAGTLDWLQALVDE
jgi:hypothetical protein